MPTHMDGREGNLPAGTQIQSMGVLGTLDGASESASHWLAFVSLCPSLDLL
jgi:hypothetical protein